MSNPKKLYRREDNKILLGVCSGLADYFDIDPVLVRLVWILITLFSGVLPGALAYLIAAAIMPVKVNS